MDKAIPKSILGSVLHLLSGVEDHPGTLQMLAGNEALFPAAQPVAFCFINPFFAP